MYDVSSRTIITTSMTGPNVGPNTYVICTNLCDKQNCVPFLSTREQHPPITQKQVTDALYDVRDHNHKILGGASPKNKARRFVYKTDDGPGPTTYSAKPIRCLKKKFKLDPTKPKLYACPVPYSSRTVAPSIPTKLDENGYEIEENGKIVKIPPFEPDPPLLDIKSQFCTKKGFKWSASASRRFDPNRYISPGPGPAAYTIKISKSRRAEEDERFREMARKATFLPRYVELKEIQAARENKPGPGAYNVDKVSCKRKKPKRPPPFIMGAKRFSAVLSDSPAPNAHCVCNCSRDKKYFSTKCVPFGVRAPRFKKKDPFDTPGPDYDIKGPLQEKIEKKKNPHALCDPPFNSTSLREISFVPKDSYFTPSSADYPEEEEENEKNKTIEISSSVFMNNVCRFFSPSDKKDYIGPAKYQDCKSFQKNRDRKTFSVREVPFNMSGARSTTPAAKFGAPCPTTYYTAQTPGGKSFPFAVSPRFPCSVESPGPGSYNAYEMLCESSLYFKCHRHSSIYQCASNAPTDSSAELESPDSPDRDHAPRTIHPREVTSTYKAFDTHNLRLKENVVHKKLRQAPRETRKRWLKTVRQRKLLKWFDVELDFEERMTMLIQQAFAEPV